MINKRNSGKTYTKSKHSYAKNEFLFILSMSLALQILLTNNQHSFLLDIIYIRTLECGRWSDIG